MLKVVLWFIVFSFLWNPSKTTEAIKEGKDPKVTKEYMIRHCGLTEEDFEGIDFDDFVIEFNLTPENLEKYDGASRLALYKELKAPYTDYTEIYRQASGKLQEEDIGHISTVIWEVHQSMYNGLMAADFEKMAVYGDTELRLDHCKDSDQISELTEEDLVFIREKVAAAGMTGWENHHTGSDACEAAYDGNFDWSIGIRLDNGQCFQYGGSGTEDVGIMEQMTSFCQTLWNRYVSSTPDRK